jgi:TonB family protein
MIPRILVPKNARPVASASDAAPRRLTSDLDARTLVPANLPHIELDPHTLIPSHIPLGVLGTRTVVPRDMPFTPLDAVSKMPDYVPLSILDSRVAVPKDAHAGKLEPKQLVAIQDLPEVIDPDVLTTGEVNLLTQAVEEGTSKWNGVARFASIALHFIVILLILFGPKVIPARNSTQAEIDRQNITNLYLPPDVRDVPKVAPSPQPKSPQMRIDPRLLRKLAPPREFQPPPGPPDPVAKEAPTPARPSAPSEPMPQPRAQPPQDSPIRPPQQPPPDSASNSLVIPRFSPGKALRDSMKEALKDGGTASAQFGGPVAPSPGGGGIGGSAGGGGGGGQGYLGGNVEILTPTEGVDFSNYIARVLASVKRNWYAVMPESARLGDRGRVVLQFRIMKNGVVPDAEPAMIGSSTKEPLDRAAVSSIRASTPFEPLPPAFSGPFIELRFIFLYNMPLNAQ